MGLTMIVREAVPADVASIVEMLADDPLGATREDAKAFYESLGSEATHEGMKLHLRREP